MNKSVLLASLLATFGTTAVASEAGKITTSSGVELIPQLAIGYKHDDNIYSAPSEQVSSNILTIDPSLALSLQKGMNVYSANAALRTAAYSYSSDDNFVDSSLNLLAHLEPSSRSRFDISADANWVTEPRGTGLNEGNSDAIDEPVRYTDHNLSAKYEYGALSAVGRVAITGQHKSKRYQNFRDISKFRDLSNTLVKSKFIYNPQTGNELFAELSYDQIDYAHTRTTELKRDSNDIRALAGIDLQATAMTSGSFKLGYQKKDFSDAGRENFSGISWEGQLAWSPLSYTRLSLLTSKAAVDPLTEGDFIKRTRHSLIWQHNWSTDFSTTLITNLLKDDYVGVTRSDTTKSIRAEGAYQFLRWAKATVYVDLNDKTSTNTALEHDKTVLGMSFNLTL